jgi:nitronate monooxygenase
MHPLLERLGLTAPIVQAPMAGVSTPSLAAAVSNAGGLGSIAIGHVGAEMAGQDIARLRGATNRAFNVNVFCHVPAVRDPVVEQAWLDQMAPVFADYESHAPTGLAEIYTSFVQDAEKLPLLLAMRVPVVSFHFGLPSADHIAALRNAGTVLFATATNEAEAIAAARAGVDAIVAQGVEAGGHRGVFDPDAPDEALGTFALTRRLARAVPTPVIAAGGIMDGAGIAASLVLGAVGAQLGTAFIACAEAASDDAHRAALLRTPPLPTVMTRVVSGRPARSLANRFTALGGRLPTPPAYPVAYDAGKALNAAARAKGEPGTAPGGPGRGRRWPERCRPPS